MFDIKKSGQRACWSGRWSTAMWSKGWNNSGLQAPQGASPFAPAPQGGAAPQAGRPDEAATGPMLGKGSELRKLYYMPHNLGHGDAVNCMLMADGKIYTGGRDEYLFVWKPDRAANGEIQYLRTVLPSTWVRASPPFSTNPPRSGCSVACGMGRSVPSAKSP